MFVFFVYLVVWAVFVGCVFFFFFEVWTIFKVFIEFITILLLFYVLGFWPWGVLDLSSPKKNWTHTPCSGKWSLNHWTIGKVSVGINPYCSYHVEIFSPIQCCLFIAVVSFPVQKLLNLVRSHLFIFTFISFTLGNKLKKKILLGIELCQRVFRLCCPLVVLYYPVLQLDL